MEGGINLGGDEKRIHYRTSICHTSQFFFLLLPSYTTVKDVGIRQSMGPRQSHRRVIKMNAIWVPWMNVLFSVVDLCSVIHSSL